MSRNYFKSKIDILKLGVRSCKKRKRRKKEKKKKRLLSAAPIYHTWATKDLKLVGPYKGRNHSQFGSAHQKPLNHS